MKISALALAAAMGLGLSMGLSACNQNPPAPAKPQEQTPVADKGADKPAADKPAPSPTPVADFTNSANFECEGGGKVDVVFNYDNERSVTARIDGGAAMTLPMDTSDTSGMLFKDAKTSLRLAGMDLGLTVDGKTRTCNFKPRELMPPKAEGVVRTLTATDAGASVEIKAGEKVAIALSGIPTAGYLWGADKLPAFAKASEGPGGPTSSSQLMPGFTGGNHWEVTLVEGVSAGSGEVTLAERRPWEDKKTPAAETFKFKLTVK